MLATVALPNCLISQLLPYDASTKTNGSLKACFKEYRLLLAVLEQAAAAINRGDLEQFDAVVGENACQIRAVKIAMMAAHYLDSIKALQAKIDAAKQKIDKAAKDIGPLMESGISFMALLQREQIDVPVSTDDLFLVETFILAAAKTVKTAKESAPLFRNDAADPKKLKQFGSDVSSSFLEELVRKTRKLLSAASVAFVREQAQSLQDRRLMRMCSDDFVVQFKTCWPCLPMFWTYKILLLSAQEKGIPIAIYVKFLAADQADRTVDEEWLYLMPPRPRADYEEQVPCPRDLSKAAVIVQGIARGNIKDLPEKSQWKAAVAARNIQAILAGAADHRQYPEEAEDKRITGLNDAEFVGYRQMALNEGYSLNNPSRFFIQHVYPAKVSSIPKLAQRAKEIGGV